jgi:hypothetical protein
MGTTKLKVPAPGTYEPRKVMGFDGPQKSMASKLNYLGAAKE